MTRESGLARIFAYNWPVYIGTWAGAALGLTTAGRLPAGLRGVTMLVAALAILWSVASLVVSFYIYDRSELSAGTWLRSLFQDDCRAWATIHAGLDAEIALDGCMPGACVARLDVYDPSLMTAPSIRRARLRTPRSMPATACSPVALALEDGGCDAVVVAFTAHEIRDRTSRQRFFEEVRRGLRPGGTMLLVEHVRDLVNFIAFGPGFLHFLPRTEWLRLAAQAGFAVRKEQRVTPWVMALTLVKAS